MAPALLTLLAVATVADGQTRPPVCAIDMGSNSFKRIVASFEQGQYLQRTFERKTLGVGDDVARNGRISDAKLTEIQAALAGFKIACDKDGAAPVVAIGTAAFREAPNGTGVIEIARKLGIAMEIATERRESELAYLVGSLGQEGFAVIDNGSRSIELAARDAGTLRYLVFNQGYRIAYEEFFATAAEPAAAVRAFRDRLRKETSNVAFMKGKKKLVGVEFVEMADVLFGPTGSEGRLFTLEELKRKLAEITAAGASGFQALKKTTDIDRALPRLVVAATLVEDFGYAGLELTQRELGAGLIIEAGSTRR